MTANLFKPTPPDIRSLKSGQKKLRKYRFGSDHLPYLTTFNNQDKLMESPLDKIDPPQTGKNPALRPLAAVPSAPAKPARKTTAKKTAKAKTPVKAATKTKQTRKVAASTDGKTALKTICQKLNIDPKAARVKLRRNASKLGFHNTTDRWMFTEAQAAKVIEVLKG